MERLGTTDVVPHATWPGESRAFLFAKGIDDKSINVNVLDTDEETWSGWGQVGGGGTTDASLTSAPFDEELYLFAKGVDDRRLYQNRLLNLFQPAKWSWTGWSQVGGAGITDVAPAACRVMTRSNGCSCSPRESTTSGST